MACWNTVIVVIYAVFMKNNTSYEKMENENPKLLRLLWVSFGIHVAEVVLNTLAYFKYRDYEGMYDYPGE